MMKLGRLGTLLNPFDREFGSRALAREYGVAKSTILGIVNRERYIGVT